MASATTQRLNIDIKKLKDEQLKLSKKVIVKDVPIEISKIGGCDQTYAKGKVIERLKLAKERLQEVEILYLCNSCEVSDKDPVKKAAMDVALNRVTEYIGFLNTRLKLIAGNEVIEKVRKLGRVEQRTEPTHTQPQRTDTGKVLGKAKKGKEVLCFEIGGEQYYRISEIADMFKTSISALHQYIGRCVDDKERTQLERDGKEKDVIYKGKRSGVYSFDIFEIRMINEFF